ncbi:MAG: M23 family metallopeptidase [Bacteroidetes bacterium]|nr:M23 family metallopeptidase [Bacteroidota bacterium]
MIRLLLVSFLVVVFGAAGYLIHNGVAGSGTPGGDPLESKEAARYDPKTTDWNDYLWPTDAGTTRTSDFAEFRSTHFHAGLDVSTGGKTGFKVFASRDGWLHAAYFEPGGYGWFLVLRHPDGYYTCYAHLDRYNTKVLNAFRARLVKGKHSYGYVEFGQDTVRVKKGEVIAFTGATGAGPAHLHFEVRDPQFNPVNPGLSKHLRPVDSLPPEMKQLMLVPLDAASSVDEKYDQRLYNVSGARDTWKVAGLPVLRGRVGIMLRAHDRAEGATDYPTPYRIALFVDGKEIFSAVSNRIQDSLGFHIRIDRDHTLMKDKKGEFRKLFREEGNLLETYWPRDPIAGVFSAAHLGAGEKKVRIVTQDLQGNKSTLTMTVMIAGDAALTYERKGTDLSMKTEGHCAMLLLEEEGAKGWTTARQWQGSESAAGVQVDLKRFRGSDLRAVTVDAYGNRTVHATWSPGPLRGSAGRLYPRRQVLFDQIVYDLKTAAPFSDPPLVSLVQGEREEQGVVIPISTNEYRAVLTAWPGFGGDAKVIVRYGMGEKEIEWTDELRAFHVSATLGGQVRSKDGRFVMSFAPADVYRDMLLTVEKKGGDSSTTYTVGPEEMPLAGRPVVSITPDPGMKHPLILAPRPIKKYEDVNLPHSVGARIGRYLGSFTLTEDNTPPTVLVNIAGKSREPVRIAITDSIAGVDWESVVVRIDKAIVPLEFDERRGLLVLPYDVFKEFGRGELSVSVKDKVGNETLVRRKL